MAFCVRDVTPRKGGGEGIVVDDRVWSLQDLAKQLGIFESVFAATERDASTSDHLNIIVNKFDQLNGVNKSASVGTTFMAYNVSTMSSSNSSASTGKRVKRFGWG